MSSVFVSHPKDKLAQHFGADATRSLQALETVAQLAAPVKGEMPHGAINAAHATRPCKGAMP